MHTPPFASAVDGKIMAPQASQATFSLILSGLSASGALVLSRVFVAAAPPMVRTCEGLSSWLYPGWKPQKAAGLKPAAFCLIA
jgi:hypothetical protein